MNLFLAVDYRHDWLGTILKGLCGSFGEIRRLSEEHEWFDGLWQREYAEAILGMAFVATQAYIIGVVADVGRAKGKRDDELQKFVKDEKIGFYSDDPYPTADNQSRIIIINAAANYYKHHDEWDGWNTNVTARQLEGAGIKEHTELPCLAAAELLFDDMGITNLSNLLAIVSEWRSHLINKHF